MYPAAASKGIVSGKGDDMNEYTRMRYVVAVKRIGRVEELYFATDDRRDADKEFNKQHADNVEYVKLYNRPQWNGSRRRAMLQRTLISMTWSKI